MPSTVPKATPISGAMMPTNMDTRPPCSKRLTTSRPSSSVPIQSVPSSRVASDIGGRSWRATVLSYRNGEMMLASSTIVMTMIRKMPPIAPVGWWRPKSARAPAVRANLAAVEPSARTASAVICS